MAIAIGGYFTPPTDPGVVDVYSLDLGNQIPTGDSLVTSGPNAPIVTLTADPSGDPNASSWLIGSPQIFASPTDGRMTVVGNVVGVKGQGPLAGVTYKFLVAFYTASGRYLTNWAFITCKAIP